MKREVIGESTEGGEATGFFDTQSRLRKARVLLFGETFRSTSDLYFDDGGSLLIGRDLIERYAQPLSEQDNPVIADRSNTETIFNGGSLLESSKNGVISDTVEARMAANQLQDFSRRVAELFSNPSPAG